MGIDRKPTEVVHPGEYIRNELQARGWTQGDLARIIGRSKRAAAMSHAS